MRVALSSMALSTASVTPGLARLHLPLATMHTNLSLQVPRRRTWRWRLTTLKDAHLLHTFLGLAVIPSLRISDKGIVDVDAFKIVPVLKDSA